MIAKTKVTAGEHVDLTRDRIVVDQNIFLSHLVKDQVITVVKIDAELVKGIFDD
jgi:hypothetical protein